MQQACEDETHNDLESLGIRLWQDVSQAREGLRRFARALFVDLRARGLDRELDPGIEFPSQLVEKLGSSVD